MTLINTVAKKCKSETGLCETVLLVSGLQMVPERHECNSSMLSCSTVGMTMAIISLAQKRQFQAEAGLPYLLSSADSLPSMLSPSQCNQQALLPLLQAACAYRILLIHRQACQSIHRAIRHEDVAARRTDAGSDLCMM